MIFTSPIFTPPIFAPGIFPRALSRSEGDLPSLDLAFALDKTLTARKGPTPTFTRASGATYVGSDGLIHGIDTSTTSVTFGTGSKTVTLSAPLGQDQMWRVGDAVEIVNSAGALMFGTVTSYTAITQVLVCDITSSTGTGTFTTWRIGYRGARFDHDPATGASKGLLIEESRRNLSTYSGAIVSGIGWFTNGVATSVSSTGADGSSSYSIIESATDSTHFVSNTGGTTATGATSIVSETNYTGSIFVKKVAGSADWVQLTLGSGGFGTSQYANFNIGNGTVGNSAGLASGIPPRIEEFPDGWYRCSITVKANATVANSAGVILALINNTDGTTRIPTYLGNASNSVLASLCQLEAGAFPLSYIPTTSGTAARSADVCSIAGTDFSSFYNQSEGTLLTDSIPQTVNGTSTVFGVSNGTANERFWNRFAPSEQAVVTSGGVESQLDATNPVAGTRYKIAVAVKLNDLALSLDGAAVVTDTSQPMPTVDRAGIGNPLGVAAGGAMHIARIQYFRKRLSNAKLQTLTAP